MKKIEKPSKMKELLLHSNKYLNEVLNKIINGNEIKISNDFIKSESTLVLKSKSIVFDYDFNSDKNINVIINRIGEINAPTIDVIIGGIKYVDFVTKDKLSTIPYFSQGVLSGEYNDKIPEIILESHPASSILLLRYIENGKISIDKISKKAKKWKMHDKIKERLKKWKIIYKLFELFQLLLISIESECFDKLISKIMPEEILDIPESVREMIYKRIAKIIISNEIEKYNKYACQNILKKTEAAILWLTTVIDVYPEKKFAINFELKK